MNLFIEAIGWFAAVIIVGAYALNISGKWKTDSLPYILCNLIGGLFFVINTFAHGAYPSMVVNIIWAFIAVFALFKKQKKG